MAKKKKSYGRRAARGEGCIRKRGDNRWEYIYTDNAGETKSAYGHSETEIVEKKRAIQAALHEGTYVDPSAYTVSTWADYFFYELYNRQNVDTRAPVHSHLKIHIKPFFGSMRLQDVSKEDVIRFHRYLVDKELATHTIENIHSTLVQLFESAMPKRLRINPARGIKIEKGVKKEMLYFSEEQYLDFMSALEQGGLCSYYEAALYRFALWAGLREGELMGLEWRHIDFEGGTVHIKQQLKKIRPIGGEVRPPKKQYYIRMVDELYYLAKPKYQKERRIQPGKKAMDLLREVRRHQISERLRTGLGEQYNPDNFVFVTEDGKHMANTTILPHFKKVAASIGCSKEMRIHDLRHSYVYNALASGLTYDQISENLGHKSVDFTKRQYGRFPDVLHEDSAAKMDAFFERMEQRKATREAKQKAENRGT